METHQSQVGNITAAAQQISLLSTHNDSFRNPRQAFIRDLTQFLTNLQHQGHDIILAGDFNERIGDDPDGMEKLMIECQLIDVMAQMHPRSPAPSTYARGRKRLDYVLVSPRIIDTVRFAGYKPFTHRFHSSLCGMGRPYRNLSHGKDNLDRGRPTGIKNPSEKASRTCTSSAPPTPYGSSFTFAYRNSHVTIRPSPSTSVYSTAEHFVFARTVLMDSSSFYDNSLGCSWQSPAASTIPSRSFY